MRLQERLLEDILRTRRVAHESGKKPHQIRLMPLDQDPHRPRIAAAVKFEQRFIGLLGHRVNYRNSAKLLTTRLTRPAGCLMKRRPASETQPPCKR